MPLYAQLGGAYVRATREGPRRAFCHECSADMLAKTGDVKIWHWSHLARAEHCSASQESEWHLTWKTLAEDGTQERAVGNRRADVLAPGGFAVEFQKSAMSRSEVLERESDWKWRLVWVFDAREAYDAERLELRCNPDRPPTDVYRNFRWAHAPERVRAATCRILLDCGESLLYVGKRYASSPLQGYGWKVTPDWAQEYILRGSHIPEPPGFKQFVTDEELAAKTAARRIAAAQERAEAGRLAAQRGPWNRRYLQPVTPERRACSPRLWEPPYEHGQEKYWLRLCFDCGRATHREDATGMPRCHGEFPPEPEAVALVRTMLGGVLIGDGRQ